MSAASWEPVIGLEVHVHLKTDSKLFCRCPVRYGCEPNHQVCPVCLALPGALPVLNRGAVERAVRIGLAVGGSVNPHSVFARKNYFYPDLPKGYQISQYEDPLVSGGAIEIVHPNRGPLSIPLTRIHMEEDAGKSVHGAWEAAGESHMDLNRAGVPLVEIVSEPVMNDAAAAVEFLRSLQAILRYADVSDADMEKGQMRCDVNLSLRRPGSGTLGTRTETKNLNSFRSVQGAIQAELARQAEILDEGGEIVQATMLFDADSGRTQLMRIKENADDYRYFPDPDLIPLDLDPSWIEELRNALPELPSKRRRRFEEQYDLVPGWVVDVTDSRALADFFEASVEIHGDARTVYTWLMRDVTAVLRNAAITLDEMSLTPAAFVSVIHLENAGLLTRGSAREVLLELAEQGGDPEALVRERGLEAVSDGSVLESAADRVLAENPEMAERYRNGETKVLNFLMGQVMKQTQGKASPPLVREILARKLEG